VANDVVFTSGLDGFFRAYDVNTGEELWNYEAQSGFNAPPAIAGDMVFVAAGFVKMPPAGSAPAATPEGATTESGPAPVAKLIAFRIGGAAAGPATAEAGATATTAPAEPTQATAEPTAEAATPADTGNATGATQVAMVDIAFNPNAITIPANTDVTISLVNNGAAVHNFNVDELNVHSGDYQPGQTGTVTINAQPGTYQYYCAIPGHKEAGMVGTITVQ
jgi:uncharacterized cupredoxin-like copper-binding protein